MNMLPATTVDDVKLSRSVTVYQSLSLCWPGPIIGIRRYNIGVRSAPISADTYGVHGTMYVQSGVDPEKEAVARPSYRNRIKFFNGRAVVLLMYSDDVFSEKEFPIE